MRLSDLLGAEVCDAAGASVGQVHDVRLVQDAPVGGGHDAGFRVQGLIVGPASVGSRLGYERREMRGPWLVGLVMRALRRRIHFVPWEDVVEWGEGKVLVSGVLDDYGPPEPIPTTGVSS